jgi:hypothetical protein
MIYHNHISPLSRYRLYGVSALLSVFRITGSGTKPEKAARYGQPFLEKEKKMKKLIGD